LGARKKAIPINQRKEKIVGGDKRKRDQQIRKNEIMLGNVSDRVEIKELKL